MAASLKDTILQKPVPEHIAIIMDGNRRWAENHGVDRAQGHEKGYKAVHDIVDACDAVGVRYLTVYAFSTENWSRSAEEVRTLMQLFVDACRWEIEELHARNVKVNFIGDFDMLDDKCREEFQKTIDITRNNTGITFNIAISYGSRWEITRAARLLAEQVEQKKLKPSDINEEMLAHCLQTSGMPDPDLLIRTSNELRISNFLLWQIAYAELYFTEVLWPDFTPEELYKAIDSYQHRQRRFGKRI